jgi:CheY-like chemotaxis protein
MLLIVDDDPSSRRVFVLQFARLGYPSLAVASGLEALTLIEDDHEFDMVLMDVRMPPPDGFETTRLIRQMSEPKCHIPVAGVIAGVLTFTRAQCLEAGMNDLIVKPVSLGILTTLLTNLGLAVG